jgi:hypothetical protein
MAGRDSRCTGMGIGSGILDRYGQELEFPSAFDGGQP